jgi:acyl-coenzyme A thioesterase PaaI-like protein
VEADTSSEFLRTGKTRRLEADAVVSHVKGDLIVEV